MGTICFKKTKKTLINTVLHTSVQRGFILVVIIFVDFFIYFQRSWVFIYIIHIAVVQNSDFS